jgi:hypothetical protein
LKAGDWSRRGVDGADVDVLSEPRCVGANPLTPGGPTRVVGVVAALPLPKGRDGETLAGDAAAGLVVGDAA